MYKFAYVFCLANKVVWSGETEESLRARMQHSMHTDRDRDLVEDFIQMNKVGCFINLSGGEMVFQTQ